MKRMISTISTFALLAWFAAPTAVTAEEAFGNVTNGRIIFQDGKGDDVPACQGCHGIDGLGSDDVGSPRLAYQVDSYILKQLTDFAQDKRTDDTMYQMNDIAKALSAQDRKDLAAYVHTLKSPYIGSNLDQLRRDGADVGSPFEGKMIAEYGSPDHGVPACKSCHGFHGRSAGRMYPAIGGQNYVYLKHELESWRNGANTSAADIAAGKAEDNARHNDYMGQMRAVAGHMTDDDIKNVAAFLTLAKPTTPGNPRSPSHK
jgi:cytochrome c553